MDKFHGKMKKCITLYGYMTPSTELCMETPQLKSNMLVLCWPRTIDNAIGTDGNTA